MKVNHRDKEQEDALMQAITGDTGVYLGGKQIRPFSVQVILQLERMKSRAWEIYQIPLKQRGDLQPSSADILEMFWVLSATEDQVASLCAQYAAAEKMLARASEGEKQGYRMMLLAVVEKIEHAVQEFAGTISLEEIEKLDKYFKGESQAIQDSTFSVMKEGRQQEKNGMAVTDSVDGDGDGEADEMEIT